MNSHKNTILIVLLLTINFSFSQLKNEVTKAQLSLLNGITKEGFTNKTDAKTLSQGIDFKSSETDKDLIHYDTSNLKSFSFNNLNFELQSINVNNNTTPIKVFCQLLLKGKASLYKSYYGNEEIFIIIRDTVSYVLQNDELKNNEKQITTYHYGGYLSMATEGTSSNHSTIDFDEKTFLKIITEYNKKNQSESEIYAPFKEKTVHYFMFFGGIGKGNDGKVIFFQAMDRIFYPNLSRTTSLNIGLNYHNEQFEGRSYFNTYYAATRQTISIPLVIQQNFSTKSFRPYIMTGIGLTYRKESTEFLNNSISPESEQKFGATFSYGAGLEVDIIKGIMAKVEYKYELYNYFLFGVGYRF